MGRWQFNKQGNLHMRLFLGSHRMSRSPNLPTRIFKVSREALTGFSWCHETIPSRGGLSTTSPSEACVLKKGSHCGRCGQEVHFKDRGGGCGASDCWGPAPSQPAVLPLDYCLQPVGSHLT